MADDIRLLVGLQGHRKVKKLERRVGIGALKYLIYIWLEVRKSCPNGDTSRWTAEDFALAAEYDGEPEKLVAALVESEWIEPIDGGWLIHDWADHQPFAVDAPARVEAARKAAQKRWNERAGLSAADAERMRGASGPHAEGIRRAMPSSLPSRTNDTQPEETSSPVVADATPQEPIPALVPSIPEWPPDLEDVRKALVTLDAPEDLHDPPFWRTIDAWLGKHPRVAYLDELAKYLTWWRAQSGRKRHRKLKAGYRNWLTTADNRDERETQRAAQQQQWRRR